MHARMNGHAILGTALLVVVLAGCSGPVTSGLTTIRGTFAEGDGFVGVGMLFVGPGLFAPEALGVDPAAIYQPDPDAEVFYTDIVPVSQDGSFTLDLPSGSDVPTEALVPAETFFPLAEYGIADCSLQATDPSAMVTFHVFETISFPGLYAVDLLDGATNVIASDAALDLDESVDGRVFVAWLYATKAVSIQTEGACEDDDGAPTFDFDVDLAQGWTQVGWVIDEALDTVELRNDATSPVVLSPFVPVFW